MKIKLSIFSAFLVSALALSACAGNTSQTAAGSQSSEASSEAADKGAGSVSESASKEDKSEVKQPQEPGAVPSDYKSITVRLGGLKGPTSLGMLKLLEDSKAGKLANTYDFTMSSNIEEVGPKLLSGELDIVAAPANMGAVLAKKSNGKVKMLAINTLGVLYIGAKGEDIKSVSDLKGKTIYASGKGGTPEYVLKYILSKNGLDPDKDVTIEWKSEHTEIISTISNMDKAVAMCPEPFMTVAKTQIQGFDEVLDLTEEWDKVSEGRKLITAGLFARADFAEKNPEQIKRFLEEYKYSTEWVNANVAEAAKLSESYDIVKELIALKAIPKCNITYIDGREMAELTKAYFDILYSYNPQSVGGEVPGDEFFFTE